MTNSEKFNRIRQITVQDIIDWLDGRAVSYVLTQKQLDGISAQYCSKKVCHTVFSKDRYGRVHLSNGRWLDNSKPFLTEFETKRNTYWDTLSKNSVRKCESMDDMARMIVRAFSPYLHFRIDRRSYDYINIKGVLAADGGSVYKHDRNDEIKELRSRIWELEKTRKQLESKLQKLESYQSIHEDLEASASDGLYTDGRHYL